MYANKLGLRITSSVLATSLSLVPMTSAWAAPPDAVDAEGEAEEGDAPEGEAAEGEVAEGEQPEGEVAEGEAPEGETAEGEGAEGEQPEGEVAEGEAAEGEAAEGEEPEPEVVAPEDEAEAELPEADEVEAEAVEEEPELVPEGPLRPPEPTWGPKDQYPMNGKGMLITGGLITGLGAAFIVTSVLITDCNFDSALSCKLGDQRDFLIPLSVAATGLGVLLVGVGIGNHVKYKRWERWAPEKTAVVPTLVPGGGGGVAWVGKF
ncbi:hypothetical protein ENSA5_49480 [Enhygromyxa salina]|uniref:Uncharacterized protein n=1 Tax=Enhygromyxa salina TaxID=215803 RepID=A0A2S9XHM8_9BACT|nr:hypothetical protein [Enhygromyxa salina]PRP92378.1 hypothetical protein ENSA5_49480 [Enhygromyxa salina]